MRGLSLIFVIIIMIFSRSSDSPHGDKLDISCSDCHTSESWKIDRQNISFDHNATDFELTGLHTEVNCSACHPTLVFDEAETQCSSCHTDMHNQSVGFECGRCHTTNSWLVTEITQIHRMSRFPLTGAHSVANCYECHESASTLDFKPLGIDCYDCHMEDYNSAMNPNHIEGGYSLNCVECHDMNAFSWTGTGINHSFFPLTDGHNIGDCSKCHTNGSFDGLSTACISCHENDYLSTTSPNHNQLGLSTECNTCHSLSQGWKPADFGEHDLLFPIYSGEHRGEWSSCTDCHPNPANYSVFTCIDCHEHNKGEMDDEHQGIAGYAYSSVACLACHPTGSDEGSINHSLTNFPLTGAHIETDCKECHEAGYTGTPIECSSCHMPDFNQSINPNHMSLNLSTECSECHTTDPGWKPASFDNHSDVYPLTGAHTTIDCFSCHEDQYSQTPNTCVECHTQDYNQSINPNHIGINIGTDCESCHTTNPEWKPATFDIHNDYYVLAGAHLNIANNCVDCHQGNYNQTPNTCYECHTTDYNQAQNPNHLLAQFGTDCEACHTEFAWKPSTFDHDGEYFPIYSGKHNGEWDKCTDCHTTPGNYIAFSCIDCHEHNKADTDEEHQGIQDYVYNSSACLECHPDGEEKGMIKRFNKIIR